MLLALVMGSCSSVPSGPPSNQNNICAIFDQRPAWRNAVLASAHRWGAPPEVQMAILWKESSFRARARTRKTYFLWLLPTGRVSSAYGYAQAIDSTWDWYKEETGNRGANRSDFNDAADFVGWYMAKTMRVDGVQKFDAFSHYIAYHEGHAGFRRGGWRRNARLVQVARRVADQAARYRGQLRNCT